MTVALGLILTSVGVIVLLALSAFFSGSETALTAVTRARMHQLENEGDRGARRVNALIADRERLIGSILLGNNLVNILATALASAAFFNIFGDAGVAYATLVMTALVLVFAEVLPKTYAITNPDRMAMTVSGPLTALVRLLSPIVTAVRAVVRATLHLFGVTVEGDVLSAQEEIRGAIDLHHKEGAMAKTDRAMLSGVLDLRSYAVSDVMVHRKSMEMIDCSDDAEEAIAAALDSRHTRLPLWRDDPENIIGVLHAKDLARAIVTAQGAVSSLKLADIAREPWFVPETTTLAEQLNNFREKREHFALVVDEYGALMGLVTLEDILEEIVGEIEDEFDAPVEGVQPQADGSFVVDGAVTVRDLNRAADWNLPDDEAVTIAGLVIHEARSIPERGQVFSFYGRRFEILERQRNQVTRLRVAVIPQEAVE